MGLGSISLALFFLLLIALFHFRLRIATRSATGRAATESSLVAGVGKGAIMRTDPMATLKFHHTALKSPGPRKGGVNVRERQPRLVGISKDVRGIEFLLEPTGTIIGRAEENRIQVSDPRVSKRHVWVGMVHDKAMVCDLSSTNGTFINAASDTPITEAELNPNDTVLLGGHGGTQFRFVVD